MDIDFSKEFQVFLPDGTGKSRYDEISARNGDLSYNGGVPGRRAIRNQGCFQREKIYALADNLKSIHVFSDVAWDEAHPAGTPLDDLITIVVSEYGSYVRSGYTLNEQMRTLQRRLSQLAAEDMQMISTTYLPELLLPPLKEPQTLTVEWTTAEGEVGRASVECKPTQE